MGNSFSSDRFDSQISYRDLLDLCDNSLRLAITEGIRALPDSSKDKAPKYFTPLSDGVSTAVLFCFALGKKKYVLRIFPLVSDTEDAVLIRMNGVLAHKRASKLGIAPELFYWNSVASIMIMEFIDAPTLTSEHLSNPQLLFTLGSSIASLHQASISFPCRSKTVREEIQEHYCQSIQQGVTFPPFFQNLYKEYVLNGACFDKTKVWCHGDLNPSNILVRKKRSFLSTGGAQK